MNTTATAYAIRVEGHLDDHWSAWLGELALSHEDDGTTVITVAAADQAQLHGVLAGLRDIGAVITELRTIGAPAESPRPARVTPLRTDQQREGSATERGRHDRCRLEATVDEEEHGECGHS